MRIIYLLEQDEKTLLLLSIDELDLKKDYYQDLIRILERKVDITQSLDKDVTSILDKIESLEDSVRDINRQISDKRRKVSEIE